MGYFKQLHIDCYPGVCEANQYETCYQQPDNPGFIPDEDEEPLEPGEPVVGDRDPLIDQEQE